MKKDFGRDLVVGGFRGYRWWRVGRAGWLESPFFGRSRWDPASNRAECFILKYGRMWFYSRLRAEHQTGAPALSCDCGFYGLNELPTEAPREQQRLSPWEVDPWDSGFGGLVLGVAEAWGRVLLGTEGWRSQFCKPLALFVRPKTSASIDTGSLETRYGIPVVLRPGRPGIGVGSGPRASRPSRYRLKPVGSRSPSSPRTRSRPCMQRMKGIRGRSKMGKEDLIEAIRKAS